MGTPPPNIQGVGVAWGGARRRGRAAGRCERWPDGLGIARPWRARQRQSGRVLGATLRHSAAVAWLESGVHIKAVADLLGHSSVAITGDVYGHTSDDTARAAVDGLATRLGL
jgi:integrase